MFWLFIVFVVGIGSALPLQALINARLGDATAGPLFASALSMGVSFLIGAAVVAIRMGSQQSGFPTAGTLLDLPAWMWLGGVVGAGYVIAATFGVPVIGAAGFIALIIFGQMTGSLILDHYGVLHPARPINPVRIAGVLLVLLGVILVLQPWRR